MSGHREIEPLPQLPAKPELSEPEPEWVEGLEALQRLMDLGWIFRTRGPWDRPLEPTDMLAERATLYWIDMILIDGHDQAQAMRYEMRQAPRQPITDEIHRYAEGALPEVVHRVLNWPPDRL